MESGRQISAGEQIKGNLQAHFAYYRRSRLLLAFGLVFLILGALFSLPAIFGQSHVKTFAALQNIFGLFNDFLIVFSAALGLFIISSHLRARNLKMVFTKPCPPQLWLVSAFLSAVAASLLLNILILVCAIAVSLVWHMRVQAGLVFVSLSTFAASVGLIGYLMFLAMIMHPVRAAVFALIFNPDIFYGMRVWTQGMITAGTKSAILRGLSHLFHFVYMVLPMVHAFPKETERIQTALRVEPGQWHYAFYSLGYALALAALCYCLSLFFLERKRLI